MRPIDLREPLARLTGRISAQLTGRPLDATLGDWRNAEAGPASGTYRELKRVCPPGSAHRPTVSGGRALVVYLLPGGRIDFTREG